MRGITACSRLSAFWTFLSERPLRGHDRSGRTPLDEHHRRVDDAGVASSARVAPLFYGLMDEQARRSMLTTLENPI